jgi:hypothetical protein
MVERFDAVYSDQGPGLAPVTAAISSLESLGLSLCEQPMALLNESNPAQRNPDALTDIALP